MEKREMEMGKMGSGCPVENSTIVGTKMVNSRRLKNIYIII